MNPPLGGIVPKNKRIGVLQATHALDGNDQGRV